MVSWIPYPADSSSDKRPLLLEHQFSGIRFGFLGSDMGYRAWQQIPNPRDEAYSNAAPAGLLIFGWIPGGMFCALVFGLNWLIRLPLLSGKTSDFQDSQVVAAPGTGDSTNPFR